MTKGYRSVFAKLQIGENGLRFVYCVYRCSGRIQSEENASVSIVGIILSTAFRNRSAVSVHLRPYMQVYTCSHVFF